MWVAAAGSAADAIDALSRSAAPCTIDEYGSVVAGVAAAPERAESLRAALLRLQPALHEVSKEVG